MCLHRDLDKPIQFAHKDVVCYKVIAVPYRKRRKFRTWLLRKLHRFKHYETYFQDTPVTIGSTVYALPAYTRSQLEVIDKRDTTLEEGFIHSYVHLQDAVDFYKERNKHIAELVKCVIPAGSYYFEGNDGWGNTNYASTALKYVKVIKH